MNDDISMKFDHPDQKICPIYPESDISVFDISEVSIRFRHIEGKKVRRGMTTKKKKQGKPTRLYGDLVIGNT